MPNEQRQPNNLTGLLQFCIGAGSNPTSSVTAVDEDRRRWLDEALDNMSVDVVGRMRTLIRGLLDYVTTPDEREGLDVSADSGDREKAEETAVESLEELTDLAENIDFAIDFMKIGGFDLIPALLNSERALGAEVRGLTASLLAAIVQNNPVCQDFLMAHMQHVFEQLLRVVDEQTEVESVRAKALSAISCSVRQHRPLQDKFLDLDGFQILVRTLGSGGDSVKTKTAFLLASLISETEDFDDKLAGSGLVTQMADILGDSHQTWHEHLLQALLLLSRRNKPSRSQCEAVPELRSSLLRRIEDLDQCPEHEETVSYSRALCEVLGWPCSETDIPVLR